MTLSNVQKTGHLMNIAVNYYDRLSIAQLSLVTFHANAFSSRERKSHYILLTESDSFMLEENLYDDHTSAYYFKDEK